MQKEMQYVRQKQQSQNSASHLNFRPNYAYLSTGRTHPNNKDDLARGTQAISTNVDKFIEKFFINM